VNPTRPPQLGDVIWAELEVANGHRKVRLRAAADIDDADGFRGHGHTLALRTIHPSTSVYSTETQQLKTANTPKSTAAKRSRVAGSSRKRGWSAAGVKRSRCQIFFALCPVVAFPPLSDLLPRRYASP
jgi:hypothetical protein